jgi:ribosomal protein L7/L12
MEISKETFTQVIRAASNNVDWYEFGITIAISNPGLFVQTIEDLTNVGWIAEAKLKASEGESRVDVTKFVMGNRSRGLKDAKDWVEENIEFPLTEDQQ